MNRKWLCCRILRTQGSTDACIAQIGTFRKFVVDVCLENEYVTRTPTWVITDFEVALKIGALLQVGYSEGCGKGTWHFTRCINKALTEKVSTKGRRILKKGGQELKYVRLLSCINALPVDWMIPFFNHCYNFLYKQYTKPLFKKFLDYMKKYFIGNLKHGAELVHDIRTDVFPSPINSHCSNF